LSAIALELCSYRFCLSLKSSCHDRGWTIEETKEQAMADATTTATADLFGTTTKRTCNNRTSLGSTYTLVLRTPMGEEIRFLWNATRGNRLRPWRSPYLRWRLETYSGQRADTVRALDFWNLFWKEKRQLFRFLRWTREIKSYTESKNK
jgi:hypothetical protein